MHDETAVAESETTDLTKHTASWKLLLDFMKDTPERQFQSVDLAGTRAVQLLTSGSVILGLSGFATVQGARPPLALGLLIAGAVTYLALIVLVIRVLRPTPYHHAVEIDQLWPNYWHLDEDTIRHGLILATAAAFAHNRPFLNRKLDLLEWVVRVLGIEAVLLTLGLIASVPWP